METKSAGLPRSQTQDDLAGQAAPQIQSRWFFSIGILEIRMRWFAALGVLAGTWIASSLLDLSLPIWPLYAIGLSMLGYNALLSRYLGRRFALPRQTHPLAPRGDALPRFYWRRLEQEAGYEAATFDRFVKVQTGLDWLAMILLVHFSGGVESPLLFFFVFHLIIASILLSPRACYFFATLATLAVGTLAVLEYTGIIGHVSLGFISAPLYQSGLYVLSVLFFFTTSLYVSVYLAIIITSNLRQKDQDLLNLQQKLDSAYQRMQTLYQVTSTVSSTLNLEEVLNLITHNTAEAMQVKACTIRLLDEKEQKVETVAACGLSEGFLNKGPIEIQKSPVTHQILTSHQPAIVADSTQDDRLQYRGEMQVEGIGSILYVPLVIRGKAEGVIGVYSSEPHHFSKDDAEFLSALAGGVATAIVNARAYQALEQADEAKSEFVRMVTHELRSPLSAVQSMLKLIEQGYVGPLTAKQQDLVQRSQRRIAFLLAMVKDLLELAAGKMDRFRGEKKEVVLNSLIAKVIDLMQASAEEKGLTVQVDVTQEPLTVVGVEDGLERVILNLVSNAVKYTPSGGSVAVRAWRENGEIRFEVSDTGIGIPEEALARIFSEFYRAKNAKALSQEGTGLGLAIAKSVVEQHGGQISADSTEGKGSVFRVTLPVETESVR
jgi:signal transduction histidine kinase